MDLWAGLFAVWCACGIVGGVIASGKGAGVAGFVLGLLFGPLGVLGALGVDGRNSCHRCGTRLNGTPEICPQCGAVVLELEKQDRASLNAEEEYVRRLRQRRGANQ